jgi:hypothetical protein
MHETLKKDGAVVGLLINHNVTSYPPSYNLTRRKHWPLLKPNAWELISARLRIPSTIPRNV